MKDKFVITAFKDYAGDITISDSISEFATKYSKIKNEFIEQVLYESLTDEQLELMLLYILNEIHRRKLD